MLQVELKRSNLKGGLRLAMQQIANAKCQNSMVFGILIFFL